MNDHAASPPKPEIRFPVKRIATHPRPHFDEIFALWLLRKFGNHRYPGITMAGLVFWDCGAGTPDGRPVADHEREGTLVLGVALGRLDEHARRRHRFGEMICSAKLVADDLHIADDPALAPLLEYASQQDSRGGTSLFDLAHLVKVQQQTTAESEYRRVLHWAYTGINARYEEQLRFIGPSRTEWAQKANVYRLRLPERTIRIGEIYSDDPQVTACGRYFGRCAIIVRHGTRREGCGNSQIIVGQNIRLPLEFLTHCRQQGSSNPEAEPTLNNIRQLLLEREPRGLRAISGSLKWPEEMRQCAGALADADERPPVYWVSRQLARCFRFEEYDRLGRRDVRFDSPALVARESLSDLPAWHLLPEAGWVFNGAITAPAVPVSRIHRNEWLSIVRRALIPKQHRDGIPLERTRTIIQDSIPTRPMQTSVSPEKTTIPT